MSWWLWVIIWFLSIFSALVLLCYGLYSLFKKFMKIFDELDSLFKQLEPLDGLEDKIVKYEPQVNIFDNPYKLAKKYIYGKNERKENKNARKYRASLLRASKR